MTNVFVTEICSGNQKTCWFKMRGNQLPVSAPGGSIGPRYVLQLLFIEKSQDC